MKHSKTWNALLRSDTEAFVTTSGINYLNWMGVPWSGLWKRLQSEAATGFGSRGYDPNSARRPNPKSRRAGVTQSNCTKWPLSGKSGEELTWDDECCHWAMWRHHVTSLMQGANLKTPIITISIMLSCANQQLNGIENKSEEFLLCFTSITFFSYLLTLVSISANWIVHDPVTFSLTLTGIGPMCSHEGILKYSSLIT